MRRYHTIKLFILQAFIKVLQLIVIYQIFIKEL